MGTVTRLVLPKRKTLLDLNTDEIERTTVEFINANRAVNEAKRKLRHASDALEALYRERAEMLDRERTSKKG